MTIENSNYCNNCGNCISGKGFVYCHECYGWLGDEVTSLKKEIYDLKVEITALKEEKK